MSDIISKHCEPCSTGRDISIDATQYCKECEESYCESCSLAHKAQRATKNHKLANIDTILDNIASLSLFVNCEPCKENGDIVAAVSRCMECTESYCENCALMHNSQRATRNHEITTLEVEKKRSICEACSYSGDEYRPSSALCLTCDEALCFECARAHRSQKATRTHQVNDHGDGNMTKAKDNKSEEKLKEKSTDEITPSTKPGKPEQVGALNVDRVTVTWSAPNDTLESGCYQMRFKENNPSAKWQFYDDEKTQHTTLTVKNLKPHSCFFFQVRLVNNEEEGPYSEISDPIETLPSAAEMVLGLSDEVSSIGDRFKLRKFRLNENQAAKNENLKTRKFILGEEKAHHHKEKTVLLLGASGTGKTTFVNGLINYIFGVTFADDYRFSIVAAEDGEQFGKTSVPMGTPPKTEWITCYSVVPVKGSKVDFRLTIIDTPGFGDKGIEKDAKIKKQLKELFSAVDEKGVLFVDVVCIFMRASESRLTVTQEYIYTTITSLFHRDIQENICSVVTFSDGKPPPVLTALKEANLPHETYFPFNTSEIFSDNIQTSQTSLTKVFFDLNISSFDAFINKLSTMKTKSLSQSKEVLEKRQQIEENAGILLSKVEKGLNKMEDCRSEISVLEIFKAQKNDNKDFKYKRKRHVQNAIPLKKGLHTTNCLHCNVTCHDNCAFANDEDKAKCIAMASNGYCKVCEDRCYWDKHKNTPFIIEMKVVEEDCTYDEMMKKYQMAEAEVISHEAIVDKMKKELDEAENEMLNLMNEIADCSNQLSQIALRANPLSVAEHIDIIIENEKWERKPGFQDRINNLEKLKKKIAIGDEFKHFQKSKKDIYK